MRYLILALLFIGCAERDIEANKQRNTIIVEDIGSYSKLTNKKGVSYCTRHNETSYAIVVPCEFFEGLK